MILIHTALLCEAQAFIEYYKLTPVVKKQIYKNDHIVVLVSGVGKENIFKLDLAFDTYKVTKVFNIGIVGCNDTTIQIASLHSSTHDFEKLPLKTVDTPQTMSDEKLPTMYDMEGEYFLEVAKKYLNDEDIYIFKVISDHLDDTIQKKDTIKKMIQENIKKIDEYIR